MIFFRNGKTLLQNGLSSAKKLDFIISKFFIKFFLFLNFLTRQHYKYEDITPARKKFLEKQDDTFTQKRQEADLSYWAQVFKISKTMTGVRISGTLVPINIKTFWVPATDEILIHDDDFKRIIGN